jgi:Sulfotransferase domain
MSDSCPETTATALPSDGERAPLIAQAFRLEWFTVAWMTVECAVAICAGACGPGAVTMSDRYPRVVAWLDDPRCIRMGKRGLSLVVGAASRADMVGLSPSAEYHAFVHYADLLADLEGGIKRIASFLDMAPSGEVLRRIVRNCAFSEMRNRGAELSPGLQDFLKGGAHTFFFKGTNGRWREVLNADELMLCDAAAARELTPDCHRWVEEGGEVK